jgi:uncharacterized protein YjbI with pentapeptide repeats
MRKLTHAEKETIQTYIKNKIDISDKLINIDISGEDLSYAIIKKFNRLNDNMKGLNLAYATIGEEGQVTIWSGNNLSNVNFHGTKFVGTVFMRRCICKGANFTETFMPNLEYQYTDFRGAKFCSAVIRIGSREGLGAQFDKSLWDNLTKGWIIT